MPQRPKRLTPSRGPLDLFGSEVRRYRTLAGLSLAQLAELIPYAPSTIGDVERGSSGCDRGFAEECDRVLDTRDALAHLHDGLFDGRSAAFPEYFAEWPDHEGQAEVLRSYQTMLVDGLLQTPAYAEVLLHGDETKVQGRLARQAILTRKEPAPPRIICLLPETVLWHRVGTAETMREQLLHLADMISPLVSLQIIPDGAPHSGHLGSFSIARLPSGESVAYCEGEPHGRIMDGCSVIERLNERFMDLSTYALSADQSGALIRQTAEERWKN
ncbi:helix-turn-helix transcriptional regulator [Actinomadura sp. NPDC049382]|uniref:helix-turn-helix domain-containing protein n=1 Tax=Actinomadura sp. NPDC049382 TaxID=3158220 RepID=UPI0034291883